MLSERSNASRQSGIQIKSVKGAETVDKNKIKKAT